MPRPSVQVYAALGGLTAATLLLELTLTRLLSVALWYPFAYVGIGAAMLGLGAGAVALATWPVLRARDPNRVLAAAATGAALTAALGYPVWNALPLAPTRLGAEAAQWLWIPLATLVLAAPFAAVGLFVARAFAAFPAHASTLYAADLGGAAVGTLLYVLALPPVGGPGLVFVSAAMLLGAALLVEPGALPRRATLVIGVCLLAWVAAHVETWLPLRITPDKLMGSRAARGRARHVAWSPGSAIEVIDGREGPVLVLDGGTALSLVPRGRTHAGPRHPAPPTGLRALAYAFGPGTETLIIGSGGGEEVSAALGAGSARVVALEVDASINALVRGPLAGVLGGLFSYPEVELHTAEARSFLAALPPEETFAAIVGFHTISNAASATGAMSLAEGYLLTEEAIALLCARLAADGVLVLSRPEAQAGRLAATFTAAAPVRDAPLAQRIVLVGQEREGPDFMTVLVYRHRAWRDEELARLPDYAGRVLYTPKGGEQHALYGAILDGDLESANAQRALLPFPTADLRTARDDRPFFNLHQPWHAIDAEDLAAVLGAGDGTRDRLEDRPVAQIAVLVFLLALGVLAALAAAPTLRGLRRAGLPWPEILALAGIFGAYGFAYIVTEIVLVQRLTRIVGEPGWSLVGVMGTMLLSSGVGSLWFAGRRRWRPTRAAVAAALAAVWVAFGIEVVIDQAAAWSFAARWLVALGCVVPVGLVLGAPFSATLQRVVDPPKVAWAWSINSACSVVGSVLALVLSSAFGFAVAAMVAAACYGFAAWVLHRAARASMA